MRIMGPPTATWETVRSMLPRQLAAPLFIDEIAPALWAEALRYGVDPLGVVAQAGKETHWGKYDGVVPALWHNTAGIKVHPAVQKQNPEIAGGDLLFAHAQFASWRAGARAHVQHLRAYAGCPVPAEEVVAARTFYVASLGHRLGSFIDLNGKWAGPNYGTELVNLARKLTEVSL